MCCSNLKAGLGPFLGRLLISLIFILSGFSKLGNFSSSAEHLRQMGISGADWLIAVALLFEIVGGLLILLGWHTKFGVYLLLIFLFPTTFIFHSFWNYSGEQLVIQTGNFFKNLAIYGGLLYILSYGPGAWSFDAARSKLSSNQ